MNSGPSNLVDAAAALVVDTPVSCLPASSLAAARKLALDSLGVAVAARGEPGASEAHALVRRWGGAPEATIWFSDDRAPAPQAAFVNSVLVHALDLDDKHYGAGMHAMSTVLPVAWAAAEVGRRPGRDLLGAVVVGVEVSTKLGEALMIAGMDKGFLPTSIVGGFGATAAAARLVGLSTAQTRNALGFWYCQASGNRQALLDRSLGKRLQPGFAARSAFWSVELARAGLSGPNGALDGQAGLFPLYGRTEPPGVGLFNRPEGEWAIESYWIKQYPSCGGCHRPTEAAIRLASEHDIDHRDVTGVVVEVGESSGWHLGSPFEIRSDPQVDAQFSIAYGVALGLVRRRAFLREYETAQVRSDTEVSDLAGLVDVRILPNTSHLRSDEVPINLEVQLADGRTLSQRVRDLQVGSVASIDDEDVASKFLACCDYAAVPAPRADPIVDAVAKLDRAESLDDIDAQLAAIGHPC